MSVKAVHFATHKLKNFRDERGWTQTQLANWLTLETNQPVSKQEINYWENGKRSMTAEKALAICDATKIPIMELVYRKDV